MLCESLHGLKMRKDACAGSCRFVFRDALFINVNVSQKAISDSLMTAEDLDETSNRNFELIDMPLFLVFEFA